MTQSNQIWHGGQNRLGKTFFRVHHGGKRTGHASQTLVFLHYRLKA